MELCVAKQHQGGGEGYGGGGVLQYRAWLGRRLAGEVGHAGHVLIEPLARWLLVRFLAKKKFWTSFLALSFQAPQFANFEPFFQEIRF